MEVLLCQIMTPKLYPDLEINNILDKYPYVMVRNHCPKEDLVCVPFSFLTGFSETNGFPIFLYHNH